VFLTNPSGVSPNAGVVLNDSMVALQDLAGGISIQCDTPIDPVSLLLNPSLHASHLQAPTNLRSRGTIDARVRRVEA